MDSQRARLRAIAVAAMRERGLEPDFPADAVAQAASLRSAPRATDEAVRDLTALPWCSIDNDDSRDLDQLTAAQAAGDGATKVFVAIADVDAAARRGSPIDRHAAVNTTSVYTPAVIFPMLPEKLSTDLTSLADRQNRLAIIFEFTADASGSIDGAAVYGAIVNNHAKLAYNAVDAWLGGRAAAPAAVAAVAGMDAQLALQDRVAQAIRGARDEHGALDLETIEAQAVFDGEMLRELRPELPNRAKSLIENLMIAANGVCARFLAGRGVPSLRRVVRTPKRWDRLVALAADAGETLPASPDSRALAAFLAKRRAADPEAFHDLSQTVIRLLGRGEYVVERPGQTAAGHFGLAVKDYTHSTAPNRRYPDLVTQRLVKAALVNHPAPYSVEELERLASRCTAMEDAANKVERQVRKSAAALLMSSRIGERFDAIVTGASAKGTFVRISAPPIEGKLVRDEQRLDVGDRVRVKLQQVDVDRGFIDFVRA